MPPPDACPSDESLHAFLLGKLPGHAVEAIADHLEHCGACEMRAQRLDDLLDPMLAAIRSPRVASTEPTRALHTASPQTPNLTRKYDGEPNEIERTPPIGAKLRGYEILDVLGRGGMAVVYKARQIELNRIVALKMIRGGGHAGPEELARFRNEAEAIACLQHPNLVQIYEIGQQEGELFLALEYVAGGTLSDYLSGEPQAALPSAAMVETLARAMHFVHEQGIIHRDLKPANVLIKTTEHTERTEQRPNSEPLGLSSVSSVYSVVKITDFGLAKYVGAGMDLTQSGMVVGTPSYMAPEQTEGDAARLGPATDVYSLGVILYEMLTGQVPFKGATPVETMYLVQQQEPVPPRRLQPTLPRDLETICLKCLEKEPHQRYPSALALAEDLRHFLNREPIIARPTTFGERAWKWSRRQPLVAALTAAVVVTAILGLVGILVQWSNALTERARAEGEEKNAKAAQQRAEGEEQKALAARAEAETSLYFSRTAQARLEWRLNHNTNGTAALLKECEPTNGAADSRAWEWHYLQGQLRGDLMTLDGGHPTAFVHALSFSPDGSVIASSGGNLYGAEARPGSEDPGQIVLWDAATGKRLGQLPGHDHLVLPLAFHPKGRYLVSGGLDRTLRVWDVASRTEVRRLPCPPRMPAWTMGFPRDGSFLATGHFDRTIRLWDVDAGKELAKLEGHGQQVHAVAVSPDGKRIASGTRADNGELILWDAVTRKKRFGPDHWPGPINALAFSPDGRWLAVGVNSTITLFDVVNEQRGPTLIGHSAQVASVAFRPDGAQLATASADGTVRLWNVRRGVEEGIFRGHTMRPRCVAYHPQGHRLASGDEGGIIKVWDLTNQPDQLHIEPFDRYMQRTEALSFAPDGKQVQVLLSDSRLKSIDAVTGLVAREQCVDLRAQWLSPATQAVFSGDGRILATVSNEDPKTIRMWDVTTGKPCAVGAEMRHTEIIYRLALNRDGSRLAGAAVPPTGSKEVYRDVKVWDTRSGKVCCEGRIAGLHRSLYGALALSADGERLAFDDYVHGAGNTMKVQVKVCDIARGLAEPLLTLPAGKAMFRALVFSPDGRHLCGADEGRLSVGDEKWNVYLWDTTTGQMAPGWPQHELAFQLAFSPDGKRLAGLNRERAHVWDVRTGHEVLILQGAPPMPSDNGLNPQMAWSSDGQRLATTNWDRSVSVWDADAAPARQAAPARAFGWHLQQAYRALQEGESAAFDFHWEQIKDAEPPSAPLRRWRGFVLACRGDWKAAAADYRRGLDESDARVLAFLAALQALAGDSAGAAQTCRLITARFGDLTVEGLPDAGILQIQALLDSGDAEERVKRLSQRLNGRKKIEASDWHLAALIHYRAGQYEEAIRSGQRAADAEPSETVQARSALLMALAYHRLGRAEEAEKSLRRAEVWLGHGKEGVAARVLLPFDSVHGLEFLLLYREAQQAIGK